jgi:prepilin-type N-terminal cleavage/methylation domain-containing protein
MKRAFTMIEILSVIAIMLLLFGISLPIYQSSLNSSEMDNALKIAVSTIRKAQLQSMAVSNDAQWGVRITSTTLTLFQGASYATRVATYDTDYTLPGNMAYSGPSEIVFSKLYGVPATTGTLILSKNGKSVQIVINAKGIQSY